MHALPRKFFREEEGKKDSGSDGSHSSSLNKCLFVTKPREQQFTSEQGKKMIEEVANSFTRVSLEFSGRENGDVIVGSVDDGPIIFHKKSFKR